MSTLFREAAVSAAFWIVVQASALLGVAALVQCVFCRRASAASRHIVWTLAISCLLLLPIASTVMPTWPIAIPLASTPAEPAPVAIVPTEAEGVQPLAIDSESVADTLPIRQVSPTVLVGGIYAAGVLFLLIRLKSQLGSVRRLARRATPVRDVDWMRMLAACAGQLHVHRPVRLLRSREHNVPVAFGTRHPSIVVPTIADTWSDDRRRAVVLHELAHVARYDCLTHALAVAVCALYWFHPAVWWVARRLRVERELACDDKVIAAGTQARDYAGHLLEIAYSFGGHRAPALAVSMARPRQLEGRLLAALDGARNRRVPPVRARLAAAAIACLLLAVVAAARPSVATVMPIDAAGDTRAAQSPGSPEKPALASDAKASARQVKAAVHASVQHLKSFTRSMRSTTHEILRLPRTGLTNLRSGLSRSVAVTAQITQEGAPGTWEIRPTDAPGTVHLRLVELNSSSGSNVPIEQLAGLTSAQLTGAGGPVQFRVRRDAGTFTFEGVIRNGVGAGTFSFAPDASFPAELEKRGFTRPTSREQYQLARHDVGYAFLDELTRQGYAKPQTSDLVRAGQHGVQATYLRDMGALGYRLGSLDPLIKLRDHGITPAYVRELADLGYKGLAADDIREARDHGITPDYVRGMREAGYSSLSMTELIKVRDHGVTPDFVRELGDAGHRKLPLDQILRVRDHGVSPEYVRELRGLGYALPIDELVRARDHGITLEYVRAMAALGYSKQPMDSLIRVRDHGVTPQYAEELKALGYDRVPLDDLVSLRDHGLTADRVRAANARAGTRLPIDMLKSLAAGGMR
jgi:beta-lactamase regulating signal transducer with metallopeptidase domain